MIVLIPHVIRRPEITPENLRAIAVGNFTTVKVNFAPKPADVAVAGPGGEGVVAPPGPGGTPAPRATAPPATAPLTTAPPATAPPATAPPALRRRPLRRQPPRRWPLLHQPPRRCHGTPGPGYPRFDPRRLGATGSGGRPRAAGHRAGTTAPAGNMRVYFEPSQVTASPSEPIAVSLLIEGGDDVASAPIEIQFDPKFLRLNDVGLGDYFSEAASSPSSPRNSE